MNLFFLFENLVKKVVKPMSFQKLCTCKGYYGCPVSTSKEPQQQLDLEQLRKGADKKAPSEESLQLPHGRVTDKRFSMENVPVQY